MYPIYTLVLDGRQSRPHSQSTVYPWLVITPDEQKKEPEITDGIIPFDDVLI